MARNLRYLEIRMKGQPLVYQVSRIQYRDKKGKLSKFKPGKLLSVEIIAKRLIIDKKNTRLVLKETVIKKHGLKLAKRKKPVTVQMTTDRLRRKAKHHVSRMKYYYEEGQLKFASGVFVKQNAPRKKGVRKIKLQRKGTTSENKKSRKSRL